MEKTNQEIYEKLIEGFNKVLSETHQLKQDTSNIIDKNDPNYSNIRKVFEVCYETQEKLNVVENRIKNIEKLLEQMLKM